MKTYREYVEETSLSLTEYKNRMNDEEAEWEYNNQYKEVDIDEEFHRRKYSED